MNVRELILAIRSYLPGRARLAAFYGCVVLGAGASLFTQVSSGTRYALSYAVWFAGVVIVGVAVSLGPVVGARASALDWETETAKEVHLAGHRLVTFQLKVLAAMLLYVVSLIVTGLVSAGIVAAVAASAHGRWLAGADVAMIATFPRLALAVLLGVPFAVVFGWVVGVLCRSTFSAALLVEGSLVVYITTAGLAQLFRPTEVLYGWSPWGCLMTLLLGGFRTLRFVVYGSASLARAGLLTLVWILVLVSVGVVALTKREVGGGRRP